MIRTGLLSSITKSLPKSLSYYLSETLPNLSREGSKMRTWEYAQRSTFPRGTRLHCSHFVPMLRSLRFAFLMCRNFIPPSTRCSYYLCDTYEWGMLLLYCSCLSTCTQLTWLRSPLSPSFCIHRQWPRRQRIYARHIFFRFRQRLPIDDVDSAALHCDSFDHSVLRITVMLEGCGGTQCFLLIVTVF